MSRCEYEAVDGAFSVNSAAGRLGISPAMVCEMVRRGMLSARSVREEDLVEIEESGRLMSLIRWADEVAIAKEIGKGEALDEVLREIERALQP